MAAGLSPLYWNFLADTLPDVALVVVAFVAALMPLVLADVAILRRKDRLVLLIVIAAATLLAVLLGLMFALSLLGQAWAATPGTQRGGQASAVVFGLLAECLGLADMGQWPVTPHRR